MRQRFEAVKRQVFSRRGQATILKQSLNTAQASVQSLTERLDVEQSVLQLLQAVNATTWNRTKSVVESIVTRGIQSIFVDRSYRFIVENEVKRNVPTTQFLIQDGDLKLDLLDTGGGISDVVSILLRLAFVFLVRPKVRQFVVFDEPTKHVAIKYQARLGEFLKEICNELDMALVVVTHCEELASHADQVFEVKKSGLKCDVKER